MKEKDIKIRRIVNAEYEDTDWREYHAIRKMLSEKAGAAMRIDCWQLLKEMTERWVDLGVAFYTIAMANEPIGYFTFDVRMNDDPNRQHVFLKCSLSVDLDEKIISKIYACFLAYSTAAKYLIVRSKNGEQDFVQEQVKAEVGEDKLLFSLQVKEAKIDLIKAWEKEYSDKFKQIELRYFEVIPDDLMDEFCAVFTELLHDMPSASWLHQKTIDPKVVHKKQEGDLKNHQYSYCLMAFDKGKLIAKTNVYLNKKKPEVMQQFMTGTLKDYRRQGIGKWMKATMFLKLIEEFPSLREIKTETSPNNHGSKAISLQMGYQQLGTEIDWLISRENIEKYLS